MTSLEVIHYTTDVKGASSDHTLYSAQPCLEAVGPLLRCDEKRITQIQF